MKKPDKACRFADIGKKAMVLLLSCSMVTSSMPLIPVYADEASTTQTSLVAQAEIGATDVDAEGTGQQEHKGYSQSDEQACDSSEFAVQADEESAFASSDSTALDENGITEATDAGNDSVDASNDVDEAVLPDDVSADQPADKSVVDSDSTAAPSEKAESDLTASDGESESSDAVESSAASASSSDDIHGEESPGFQSFTFVDQATKIEVKAMSSDSQINDGLSSSSLSVVEIQKQELLDSIKNDLIAESENPISSIRAFDVDLPPVSNAMPADVVDLTVTLPLGSVTATAYILDEKSKDYVKLSGNIANDKLTVKVNYLGRFVITDVQDIVASNDEQGQAATDQIATFDGLDIDASGVVNVPAPSSSVDSLEPGTYTVTANVYVPGEQNEVIPGVNAYMTNPANPFDGSGIPTNPMYDNAVLQIKEDGSKILDIDLLNPAFQVMSMSGEDRAHIIGVEFTGGSVDLPGYGTYVGRISHLTLSLDDYSGHYTFTDCVEAPPIGTKTWDLHLGVDFANASAPKTTYSKTFTDEATGVSVAVTTKDDELGKALDNAAVSVRQLVAGDALYDSTSSRLSGKYVNDPQLLVYAIDLQVNGVSLDLSKADGVIARLTDAYKGSVVYRLDSNGMTEVEKIGETTDPVGWKAGTSLGTFAIFTNYLNAGIRVDKSWIDSSGVSATYHGVDQMETKGTNFPISAETLANIELRVHVETEGAVCESALSKIENSKLSQIASPSVKVYRAGLYNTAKPSDGMNYGYTGITSLEMTIPTLGAGDEIYLVREGGKNAINFTLQPEVIKLGVSTGSSFACTPINVSDEKQGARLKLLYRGSEETLGKTNNFNGVAYFVVIHNADTKNANVEVPAGLVYSGVEQIGVKSGDGYTLTGTTSATDAGTYTTIAALGDGYVWSDGTSADKELTWSIAPAELTATYVGETVAAGAVPSYPVSVEGFVDGENVTNAADFAMPAIADEDKPVASELVTGFSKELTPSGGSAKNYQFKYVGGTLKVVAAAGDLKPGTYTVTANLFVPGELNKVLGVNAYLTNPSTPLTDGSAPTKPVSDNATLTVAEDGAIALDLDVVNPVFTLQKIDGSTNAQATVTGRGDSVGTTDAQYKTRISKLSIKLSDTSGTYVFSDCLEYPTLLSQVWTVPLTLNVDFSNIDTVEPTPDPTPDPEPGQVTKVDAPRASGDLTYNGKTQTGVAASKAYTLTGATAKDAGTYTATATLNEGYEWADGTTAPKTVTYTIAKAKLTATYAGETIAEGATPAYAVDVTGFVNGETILTAEGFKAPSVSAVASSKLVAGKSFTLTPAGGAAKNYSYIYVAGTLKVVEPADTDTIAPGTYQITANLYVPGELNTVLGKNAYLTNASTPLTDGNAPLTPVSDNAKLVVRDDGSRVLVIPVVNPVFTLQSVANGENVKVLGTERGGEVVGSTQVSDRVTMLYLELGDDSGSYQLGDCVEFPTLLNQEWNVPLRISADFSSLKKLSGTSTITIPGQSGADKPDNGNTGGNNGGATTPDNGNANQGNNGSGDNNGGQNGNQGTTGNGDYTGGGYRLTAGTYTVTANIWLSDRSATGLPLMPYLTSGDFPPMYPVTGNATLTVDESGHATLRVPITIQSKVMTVSGISGLSVVGTEYSGGYVSAVTIDLGTITDMSGVITRSCSATIVMGSLASTISGITGSHTWPATFQVVFTGVPVSGNAGSSYDWSKAAAGSGSLAAGVGSLAAEGAGAPADLGFLATATKAASQMAIHAAAGELEASTAQNISADFACAGVSNTLTALDPDAASGTDATAALALAAALTGSELELASGAENFEAAFLGGKAA